MKRLLQLALAAALAAGPAWSQDAAPARNGRIHVGWATRDITPDRPVNLAGQMHPRISKGVAAPLSVTALAIEVRDGDRPVDQALLVSCDLAIIGNSLQARVRKNLDGKLKDLDPRKLLLSATHTHTAPDLGDIGYEVTQPGVMSPEEYVGFLVERLTEAAEEAWRTRAPGGVNWGLGYAVVGLNRRMVYSDGRAVMYGRNDGPDFRGVEGYEDHGVESMFFWDAERKLTGVIVNVACPSQVVEGASTISSDFWHDVRVVLREKHSKDLHVLGWCGASGDQSPHPQLRKAADARMRRLHGNVSETRAIADRLAGAVDYAYRAVKDEILSEVPFAHHVEDLRLPGRKITEAEYRSAKAACDEIDRKEPGKRGAGDPVLRRWHGGVVDRYERPQEYATFGVELHVLRLGDIAIASNPFELFVDYGIQIKARSRGLQTFLIQLAGGWGGYLPTERAVAGGGYSAVPQSGLVGPDGGRALVDRTVERINGFWPAKVR